MDSQNRVLWISFAAVLLVLGAILFQPVVEERLAPELETAWVAIELGESGIARVGPRAIESGTPFTLHAVLQARARNGEAVYYTEAPGLERIAEDGTLSEVPAEALRTWDRPQILKVRWFTVEPRRSFVALEPGATLDPDGLPQSLHFDELLRSEWPVAWSVPGEVTPANTRHLEDAPETKNVPFGTQRYHVRFEVYDHDDQVIAPRTVRSWGAAEVFAETARFPTVRESLPGPAGPASAVFGLTQWVLPEDPGAALLTRVTELARDHLAFSRATVLRDQLRVAGLEFGALEWRRVELGANAAWDRGAAPGDLVRAAGRLVVLYRDRGVIGAIDYEDLAFDYARGARVRALGEIFTGGGQTVELATLGGGG